MSHLSLKLSTIVSVAVMTGAVVCHLGEDIVTLGAGDGYLYAEEAIPDALKGFQGMMSGQLIKKGERAIRFKIGKITRKWKGNKAENPEAAVGETITLDLNHLKPHHRERILSNYKGLKEGDEIVLEAFDLGGKTLSINESLKKVGAEGD